MAKTQPGIVISHWYKLIENLQVSTTEFYASVEAAIQRREIPDASISRVEWKEGGILSARRVYLRVTRGEHVFDICGAPFGIGFFFSSWLTTQPPSLGLLYAFLLLVATFTLLLIFFKLFGFLIGLFLAIVTFPLTLWLLGHAVRQGKLGSEDAVLAIPVVSGLYERMFKPSTYYKIDTALMFQSAVHTVVLEVVDELTKAKGLRALSESERKPILREFFQR